MHRLGRITDSDITGGGAPAYLSYISRYGARGVLRDRSSSNVGMMHMTTANLYKLPGGGIDAGEQPRDAFLREILEETGYEAEITHELGFIEEHKRKNGFMQYSYCYVADANRDTGKTKLSLSERRLGMTVAWMPLRDAIEAMERSYRECGDYSKRFMLLRDWKILEQAKTLLR
jgi:ADP-ribose pyrophosphatase YjhB (NUDIX family)